MLDRNKDGAVSANDLDWSDRFDQVAKGKDSLSPEEFRDAILAGMSGTFLPGDAPTREMLIRGLYEGSLGSMQEGPKLNQPAPDFTLKTRDGKESVQLSKVIGPKPVVYDFRPDPVLGPARHCSNASKRAISPVSFPLQYSTTSPIG